VKVKLIAHTPEPERVVASAARLCYSGAGALDLKETLTEAEVEKLIKKLISLGHLSPFEHANFTFSIEGISRACSHQLVRHRIASYSQRSQRYVNETDFSYVTPKSIIENEQASLIYVEAINKIMDAYEQLGKLGIPKEDARYILPNATKTKIVCSMNARALYNFFRLRCCNRAQWEIRELAVKMREEVRKVAPILFAIAGPSCETEGVCREGEFSCGYARKNS